MSDYKKLIEEVRHDESEEHPGTCYDCGEPWPCGNTRACDALLAIISDEHKRCCEGDMMGGDLCRDCPRRSPGSYR